MVLRHSAEPAACDSKGMLQGREDGKKNHRNIHSGSLFPLNRKELLWWWWPNNNVYQYESVEFHCGSWLLDGDDVEMEV